MPIDESPIFMKPGSNVGSNSNLNFGTTPTSFQQPSDSSSLSFDTFLKPNMPSLPSMPSELQDVQNAKFKFRVDDQPQTRQHITKGTMKYTDSLGQVTDISIESIEDAHYIINCICRLKVHILSKLVLEFALDEQIVESAKKAIAEIAWEKITSGGYGTWEKLSTSTMKTYARKNPGHDYGKMMYNTGLLAQELGIRPFDASKFQSDFSENMVTIFPNWNSDKQYSNRNFMPHTYTKRKYKKTLGFQHKAPRDYVYTARWPTVGTVLAANEKGVSRYRSRLPRRSLFDVGGARSVWTEKMNAIIIDKFNHSRVEQLKIQMDIAVQTLLPRFLEAIKQYDNINAFVKFNIPDINLKTGGNLFASTPI